MRVGLLSWCRRCTHDLAAWAGRIGAPATDTNETALQRRLTIALFVGTVPLTVLWSAIYLLAHVPFAAAIPAFYSVFTLVNTAFFAWTRNLEIYRFTQLLLNLILPWLVTIALGGFRQSSVVIIWAALCPLGSLLLEELRRTLLWIVGFVALLVLTAVLQPYLGASGSAPRLRHLVLRAQRRIGDRDRVWASASLRRPPQLLSGTLGDAAAQHPAEGDLRGAEDGTARDRRPL